MLIGFLTFIIVPFICLHFIGINGTKLLITVVVIHLILILGATIGGVLEFSVLGNNHMARFGEMMVESGNMIDGEWVDKKAEEHLGYYFLLPYITIALFWQIYLWYIFSSYSTWLFVIPALISWMVSFNVIVAMYGGSTQRRSNPKKTSEKSYSERPEPDINKPVTEEESKMIEAFDRMKRNLK